MIWFIRYDPPSHSRYTTHPHAVYELLNSGGHLCVADLDKEDGSFHGHDAEDVHKGFDQKKLAGVAEKQGFINISFSTAYKMEREVNESDETKLFPIFLMVAQKE
ncbi:hypothetical protein [Fodinibius salinus]|uniref:hypothetical protein n=1 Tax=Fodinibius salinus TaxID=860790 RepID=UPI0011E805EA|nr:hypothetical protein [Fodinibius salinus]